MNVSSSSFETPFSQRMRSATSKVWCLRELWSGERWTAKSSIEVTLREKQFPPCGFPFLVSRNDIMFFHRDEVPLLTLFWDDAFFQFNLNRKSCTF